MGAEKKKIFEFYHVSSQIPGMTSVIRIMYYINFLYVWSSHIAEYGSTG